MANVNAVRPARIFLSRVGARRRGLDARGGSGDGVRPHSGTVFEEEREKKGERLFGQEYLCTFLQSEDCLFRQEDLDACLRDDLEAIF